MNIIHVCASTDRPDGIKTVLKKLSFNQRLHGNEVRVFSINPGENDFKYISSISFFNTELNSDKPDIVIFHSIYYVSYIPLILILWLKKIPYAIELHGALSKENYRVSHTKKIIANAIFYKFFIKKAKCIIYLNKREYENSIVKTINPNFVIIPNGCDPVKNIIRPKTKNLNHPVQIMYLGRIERVHKGLDILLDAIELISTSDLSSKVYFTFWGDGSKSELSWFRERLARINNIAEFRGPVHGEQKELAFKCSDVFILTSRYEGMPMAVLEALSFGLPCILTLETNLGEEVISENAGWMTEGDPAHISEVIARAVSDYHNDYSALECNAVSLSNKYNWSKIALMSITEYQKMVNL